MSDLHQLSATEQLRALRAGAVSSRDLTEHYLTRIEELDGQLGAFVTVIPELAIEAATHADARLSEGEFSPLLGLPIGVKDLYPTAGVRTTFGSAAMPRFSPSADAWTVGLLRQAGVVLIGKTNTAEFGATCYTHNDVTPRPTGTPYDLTRYASGSSGGAAAAVAAGLLPVAHASDGAGSTRTPASTCHLVGFKPSRGLVSSSVPPMSLSPTTIEGPVARTVQDAALLLDVMAQPWRGDLDGWRPDTCFVDASSRAPTRPLTIGCWTQTGLDGVEPHPEAVHAVRRTASLLEELGHTVRELAIPAHYDDPVRQALHTWFAASVTASVSSLVPAEGRDLLLPYTRYLFEQGTALTATELLTAHGALARYASSYLSAFDRIDIALTPTTSGPPAPFGYFLADGVEGVADLMLAWSCYTPWANFTGQPAISLPVHLDGDGLPYGVQLVGRPRHDGMVLSLAAQLEEAARWDDVHPPCWDQ
jgi:amidase